ncbi:MAG: 3-methyl-2-oxobutanoate dehydrogenase subunit VorB [Gemmatimonadota bacterium]|jgi:pyruvate/2-oxoacid:ferredoxin oxidoreductase alpha subunit/NAD-dependent dihydropyrimidine dehydrogenase PreA subunit|nr:pyruvate ferredoxin oxidoreductase [Gemmatimonadota bacterium]MDP6529162.1 3-methyl-2-oxobutanoate dehydrogenase subunit VorB [Gemmatimonadota bacterium]MDP6802851.1 3-methyl-2-oxobutanoate dehydrogenase subunit VorB [Gemmatimonadota bacterium]MDP7032203.1 3-methyl-2-oxobutanoate dehydrogenase subunit VorB [Gemmatimonadota bacterium]
MTGKAAARPKPTLLPQICKGCGRCIAACPKDCIEMGQEIHQESGLVPVVVDWDICNGCGVCISACPEPYGLVPNGFELQDPAKLLGETNGRPRPASIPDRRVPLPRCEPMVLKGNHAAALGAILAGCRHVFGYPITPSTEGAELMAALQPQLGGIFLQAISEIATVNHMYGCGGAGKPSLTFTSSPGFSLMLEGISYMVGSEVPAVFINVMRGGPGLGNIAPEQADIKLVCRGLGHGNTHAIVLAPTTPQQMLDYTMDAFRLAFKYRNPVVVVADGYLGQMTGKVDLPSEMVLPGIPDWAVWGDADHRGNLISSIYLDERDLETHNQHVSRKFGKMTAREQRADLYRADDAELLIIACTTPARMAKGAVERVRKEGHAVGLFHPITLWPFPIDALRETLGHVRDILVVEASDGQLEDELRLALSHADIHGVGIHHLRHMGGVLPQEDEITDKVHNILEVAR